MRPACARTKSLPTSTRNWHNIADTEFMKTTSSTHDTFSSRLDHIRGRIERATVQAGREPGSVSLLPVSKIFGESAIREAMACGLQRFGENKVQEIVTKQELLSDTPIEWVMI